MAATLTENEFSKHVNTRFRVNVVDAPAPIVLDLVEVKGYPNKDNPGEQGEMERFSLYFHGPATFLPQAIYPISHEGMGDFDLFLVPIGSIENGFRYEAVFNYHVKK